MEDHHEPRHERRGMSSVPDRALQLFRYFYLDGDLTCS